MKTTANAMSPDKRYSKSEKIDELDSDERGKSVIEFLNER